MARVQCLTIERTGGPWGPRNDGPNPVYCLVSLVVGIIVGVAFQMAANPNATALAYNLLVP